MRRLVRSSALALGVDLETDLARPVGPAVLDVRVVAVEGEGVHAEVAAKQALHRVVVGHASTRSRSHARSGHNPSQGWFGNRRKRHDISTRPEPVRVSICNGGPATGPHSRTGLTSGDGPDMCGISDLQPAGP